MKKILGLVLFSTSLFGQTWGQRNPPVCPSSSASGTAYTATCKPNLGAPHLGSVILWEPDVTNSSTTATLAINGASAANLSTDRGVSSTLVTNSIKASPAQYLLVFDGTRWQLSVASVQSVSAPVQYTVTNSGTTPAIALTTLPNSYTHDPNTPYVENSAIRHVVRWLSNGSTGLGNAGDSPTITGTISFVAPGASLPANAQITIANGSAVGGFGQAQFRTGRTNGIRLTCIVYVGTSLTNVRIACGLSSGTTLANAFSAAQPAFKYAEVAFDQSGAMGGLNGGTSDATHWLVCTGTDGTHQNCASTGVTVVVNTKYTLEIFEDITNSKWTGFVNGANGTDQATNNPASGQNLAEFAGAQGTGAVTGTWNFSMLEVFGDW